MENFDTSRSVIFTKYIRYYPKLMKKQYFVYVLSRLINVFSLYDSLKIMTGYFSNFRHFKISINRIKKFKVFSTFSIEEIDNEISKFRDFKFKKIKYRKKSRTFKVSKEKLEEIDKLRNKELYEHYCDIREIKTGYRDTFSNPEVTKNTVQNNIKKYGVRSTAQLDWVIQKQQETNIKKYGVKSQLCKKEIRNSGSTSAKEERSEIPYFEPTKEYLETFIIDGEFDIRECAKSLRTFENVVKELKKKYKINVRNTQYLRKTQNKLFNKINAKNKFQNYRFCGKELDIFLPDHNLAIEYDGLMFHSEGTCDTSKFLNKDKNYHLEKTEICLNNRIQLFHIFEGEDLDLWLSMINTKLNLNKKIYARKCKIKELKSQETKEFLDYNHIQGYVSSKVNLGLYFEDELVSVMTFSKPRFNKNYEYELIRFCSKRNTSVIGGASKLWKYFVTKYNPKSVISYANRRFSNGEIYSKLGFELIGKTEPNYFYFKMSTTQLYSRVKFQKHKLSKLLDNFNPELSETENMFNNNYRRIFDCGNLKYLYINK